MRLKPLLFGLATVVPGVYAALSRPTGGTDSPRYCYTVWLRHLVTARAAGLERHPSVVAEMGPGDSLGVGLAALISGADAYYAVDVVQRADVDMCLRVFDGVLELFERCARLPDAVEYPRVRPTLTSYEFPHELFEGDALRRALDPVRVKRLRAAVAALGTTSGPDQPGEDAPRVGADREPSTTTSRRSVVTREGQPTRSVITYVDPAHADVIPAGAVDLVISQGVLEYPDDLRATHEQIARWLRPGGVASHAVDFGAHQTSNAWDGHWTISDFGWACLRGRQPYFLNRVPHSGHLEAMRSAGLAIVSDRIETQPPQAARSALAPRFAGLSDADRSIRCAFIQARKPAAVRTAARSMP
jgi:hypothetical protein